MREAYKDIKSPRISRTFFRDLPERIATAQLVIARAGASTVAELMAIGRPCLLVPLPHALDNDQLENATRLQEGGGGWCIGRSSLRPSGCARSSSACSASPELSGGRRAKAQVPWPRSKP